MKKLLLSMLLVLFIVGCDKEQTNTENPLTGVSTKAKTGKVNVCHKGEVININGNAVSAHKNHGDAVDLDGDGFFDIDNACSSTDCNDYDAAINSSATEIIYNGIDDDCDPTTPDDDLDGDGFLNADDCDDNNAAINLDAEEICDNGIDDNCNGEVDEDCFIPFVTICDKDWMLKNLDVDTYRDGTPIMHARSDAEWVAASAAGTGAWCYYENNTSNDPIYGKLYNFHAVTDPRGLAPEGWHVPGLGPVPEVLFSCFSDSGVMGGQMKSIGTIENGTGLWHSPNTGATNSSGFTGLPGGSRQDDGTFAGIGDIGTWWSPSANNEGAFALSAVGSYFYAESYTQGGSYGAVGLSVRCVRD